MQMEKKKKRFDNHHHQVELKNAGNPSYGKNDSPRMRNLEKIEKNKIMRKELQYERERKREIIGENKYIAIVH